MKFGLFILPCFREGVAPALGQFYEELTEMVRLAASVGGNAANVTSIYDGTALIAASHLGHAEVVRALIEAKAPLDHINNLGWTALLEVVILGDGGPRHR